MTIERNKQKLTKSLIDGLLPQLKEYSIWDTECSSFHIRILPSGSISYNVYSRNRRGVQSRRSLGLVNTKSVVAARKEAQAIIVGQRRNLDPFSLAEQQRAIPTLAEFWPEYLEVHAIPRKAARSVKEDRSLWTNHLVEEFGSRPVSEITRAQVRDWHARKSSHKASANRALSLISKMLTLCVENEFIPSNPCFGIARYPEKPKERYLSPEEISRLFNSCDADQNVCCATLVKLLILSGARRGEVLKADWQEFELSRRLWTVPSEHIKGGERHALKIHRPLSDSAVDLLLEWQRYSGRIGGLVFPSDINQDKPRFDLKRSWERICLRADLPGLRLHDLRHTFASLALENGASLDQIGRVLGHRSSQTTRRYAHLSDSASAKVVDSVSAAIFEARNR